MYCITSRIWDRPTRDCCTLSQRQNGYSVVPEHPHVGPHGPNRASFLMNPMYSIARTRQCPRKSCSPRQPMAAYMWNGLQPVTSLKIIPYPNPNPDLERSCHFILDRSSSRSHFNMVQPKPQYPSGWILVTAQTQKTSAPATPPCPPHPVACVLSVESNLSLIHI